MWAAGISSTLNHYLNIILNSSTESQPPNINFTSQPPILLISTSRPRFNPRTSMRQHPALLQQQRSLQMPPRVATPKNCLPPQVATPHPSRDTMWELQFSQPPAGPDNSNIFTAKVAKKITWPLRPPEHPGVRPPEHPGVRRKFLSQSFGL